MIVHELDPEEFSPVPGGWALRASCLCGFAFIARAVTRRKAAAGTWRKLRDHEGFAMAAGPGQFHH